MKRFLIALRAALAAFVAWLRYSPSREVRAEAKANLDAMARELGPYRRAALRERTASADHVANLDLGDDEPDTWAEAQRDLTPADLRAAEARRQNAIVEPPFERFAYHRDELEFERLRAKSFACMPPNPPRSIRE